MFKFNFRKFLQLTLALSTFTAMFAAAQNNALYVARTEHANGGVNGSIVQPGGITEIRIPEGTYSVTYWMKQDIAADNNSKDDLVNRGNNVFMAFRLYSDGVTGVNPWTTIGGENGNVLAHDNQWHYHLVTFTVENGTRSINHYIDGAPVSTKYLPGGPLGEFYFIIGAHINLSINGGTEADQIKRSSDYNFLIDDIAVWTSADSSIFDKFAEVANFGMSRFDSNDPDLSHYYNCNTAQATPAYYEDSLIQTTGSAPSTSWYEFSSPAGGIPLHDASDARQSKIEVTVNSPFGASLVTPNVGTSEHDYDGTSLTLIDFIAPEFIYLDRYGNELGSSDDPNSNDWLADAVSRQRNLGYAVRLGGRPDVSGTARFFSQSTTETIDITWNWETEYAVIVDSSTADLDGLDDSTGSPTLTTDDGNFSGIRTFWVKAGSSVQAGIGGIIFAEGEGGEVNVSFRSTGYFVENGVATSSTPDRSALFSTQLEHMRADDTGIDFGSTLDFTLEYWAKRDVKDVGSNGTVININHMNFGYTGDSVVFGTSTNHTDYTPVVSDLEWRHWAFQYDSAEGLAKLYLDGSELWSTASDGSEWNWGTIETILIGVGYAADETSIDKPFTGSVNNLRLWSTVRTEDELVESMTTQEYGATTGLELELTFDDDINPSFGLAGSFLTDSAYMAVEDTFTLPTNYTLEARLLFPLPTTLDGDRIPFSFIGDVLNNFGSPMSFSENGDLISYSFPTILASRVESPSGYNINALSPGWHRVSAAVQGDAITYYVDGVLVGTGSNTIDRKLIFIGSTGENSQTGWVDDLRVWGTARSASQIASDWYRPLTGTEANLTAYYTFDDGAPGDVVSNVVSDSFNCFIDEGGVAASPPGGSAASLTSTEGGSIPFALSGYEAVFASSATVDSSDPDQMWAVVFPTYEDAAQSAKPQMGSESFVVDDWLRLSWAWNRSFRLQIEVNDTPFGTLPYIITETETYDGIDEMDNVWVPEFTTVTVGTRYRTSDGCFTLDADGGIAAQLNAFRDITLDTVVDGSFDGSVTREFIFADITGPGDLLFTYSDTIHRTEITLGEGLDVSSTAAVNAQLVPNLCGTDPVLALGSAGPDVAPPALDISGGTPGGSGDSWAWDQVGQKFYPLKPGVFTLTWPDTLNNGDTYTIEITAAFPTDTVVLADRENADGTRQNGPTYETSVTFASVDDAFPASPSNHYHYVYSASADKTPPVALDEYPGDRWFFQRMPYSEDVGMVTDATLKTFSSTVPGRAVMLYSYRPDSTEVATGDPTKEAFAVRIVNSTDLDLEEQSESAITLPTGEARRIMHIDGTDRLYGRPTTFTELYSIGSDADRTWESWLQLDAEGVPTDQARVIFQIHVADQNGILQFGIRAQDHSTNPGGFYLVHKDDTVFDESFTLDLDSVPADTDWHHWALVFEGNAVRIYRDGVRVAEDAGPVFDYVAQAQDNIHNYGFSQNEPDLWFYGSFDNMRYWGQAKSADEIRELMINGVQTSPAPNFSFSFDTDITGVILSADDGGLTGGNLHIVSANSNGTDNTSATADPLVVLVDQTTDSYPEVATRILSKLDTAGLGSGYLLNKVSNFNPQIYNRSADVGFWGSVYPVNWSGLYQADNRKLHIAYYENPYLALPDSDTILHPDVAWPYIVVDYDSVTFPEKGTNKDNRIYISSRLGSEGVDLNSTDQTVFNPDSYENLAIYNQPSRDAAGFNPNEEHAVVAASIKALLTGNSDYSLGQNAAFALQNGLNIADTNDTSTYTSEAWVLIDVDNLDTGEAEMAAYKVELTRAGTDLFPALDPETHEPTDTLGQPVDQPTDPIYDFIYPSFAGDLVQAPYPLNTVVGNLIMNDNDGADSFDLGNSVFQRTLWFDKNHNGWVVSGDSQYVHRFWYPMRSDFWIEINGSTPSTSEPIAWLPENGNYLSSQTPEPEPTVVVFDTFWESDYPTLKPGETMTYVGGEHHADNPLDEGLPGIVGWKSGQIIFDTRTPSMVFEALDDLEEYSARVIRPLDAYKLAFPQVTFSSLLNTEGEPLTPASDTRVHVVGSRWYFKELTGSLQKRFYFDSLVGELVFRGRLNNLENGDPDLTSTPISLYILEPNVMSPEDYDAMVELGEGNEEWEDALEEIYLLAQNPEEIEGVYEGQSVVSNPASVTTPVYLAGMGAEADIRQVSAVTNGAGTWTFTTSTITSEYMPLNSLGTGAALVPNPTLISEESAEPLYLTLVENNNALVSGAVALHIIQIGDERFRGAIKLVEAQNVFDEKVNLRHTADFGGNTDEAYYQWWVRNVDNLDNVQLPGEEVEWQLYAQGLGLNQIEFSGRPDIMMADKLFHVRYGEMEELDAAIFGNDTANEIVSDDSWRLVDINSFDDNYDHSDGDAVPFQWAGAFNSPQLQADGSKRYLPQLVMGWVKRVLDRVNPYEARYSDTFTGDAPVTFSSMIQQAGKPFVGDVALNSDKDVIENVGLIELYETVLARARELTLDVDGVADDGTNQALLLAATRLSVLYDILASEAYADAQNSSLPVVDENGLPIPGETGLANPFIHSFQDQVASLLHEELALLRGTDFLKAYPSYNRLFWNYVKGLGEAAYNVNYFIQDIDQDGIIDESDAAILYPQGHGDAWGHYLSANDMHYTLLRHPAFDWQARAELYSLLDNVLPADYLDEKSFARIAAAKARAGLEIVRGTYRLAYTEDPDGQWQGYTDTADPARAWGVSEWAKRTGQATLFDWIVGNALVPDDAGNTSTNAVENLDRIDRVTNQLELGEIAGAFAGIQITLDSANFGNNPLGLNDDALVFDINPLEFEGNPALRKTHFEQVYDRAVAASINALTALGFASRADAQLRRTSDDTRELQIEALKQDFDYRNRLIEIFGTPYAGTIGPGQLYVEGYNGPDTLLYMYIDRIDTENLEVESDTRFVNLETDLRSVSRNYSDLDFDNKIGGSNLQGVNSLFVRLFLTEPFAEVILESDGYVPEVVEGEEPPDVIHIKAPVNETADFAFQVPDEDDDGVPDWGQRAAYGKIQILLNEMLAAENAVDVVVDNYNDYLKEVFVMNAQLKLELNRLQARSASRETASAAILSLEDTLVLSEFFIENIEASAAESYREGLASAAIFPLVNGVAGNDVTAPFRFSAEELGLGASVAWEHVADGLTLLKLGIDLSIKTLDRLAENDAERLEDYGELIELVAEFSSLLKEEGNIRLRITQSIQQFKILEREIHAAVSEGFRLQNERAAFNQVLASKAQKNRYRDLATRLTRNDAMGKYQSSFDNALRYTWLAAKAYDYETSLDPGDPAAVTTLLETIIKTRQLGLWENEDPKMGNGGLAQILAQMKGNFDVLRGQLGINNPQSETGQLSLRHEHFRILTGSSSNESRWQQALQGARVDDLWDVPEFRRFCRPFAAESDGAQPGLVIRFSTSINPAENVFGRPLAGGDSFYSSANFATKISAIGAWFEGYNDSALATTPRIYLIPVGSDVLRIANSDEPETRSWNILEQRIPIPYVINTENLTAPGFIPSIDSLDGSFDEIKRFGDFRAYHTSDGTTFDTDQLTTDSRLIGRSVWNTQWLLIIPGITLSADADSGLDDFIGNVTDINLVFETYSNSGL